MSRKEEPSSYIVGEIHTNGVHPSIVDAKQKLHRVKLQRPGESKRPRQRFVPPIENDNFDPEELQDWKDRETELTIDWSLMPDEKPYKVEYTEADLKDIQYYQEEQEALADLPVYQEPQGALSDLPVYPLKEPRRDPKLWRSRDTNREMSRLIFSMYALEAYASVFLKGNSESVVSTEQPANSPYSEKDQKPDPIWSPQFRTGAPSYSPLPDLTGRISRPAVAVSPARSY